MFKIYILYRKQPNPNLISSVYYPLTNWICKYILQICSISPAEHVFSVLISIIFFVKFGHSKYTSVVTQVLKYVIPQI